MCLACNSGTLKNGLAVWSSYNYESICNSVEPVSIDGAPSRLSVKPFPVFESVFDVAYVHRPVGIDDPSGSLHCAFLKEALDHCTFGGDYDTSPIGLAIEDFTLICGSSLLELIDDIRPFLSGHQKLHRSRVTPCKIGNDWMERISNLCSN